MNKRTILLERREDGAEAAALLVDGRLQDLLIRSGDDAGWGVGALALGRVDRVALKAEGGGGAAFLSFGEGQERGYFPKQLAHSDQMLAELRAYPGGSKAWPLSMRVALRSRRLALTPEAPGLNMSRRIKGQELRARIQAQMREALGDAEDVGCVARSICGAEPDALREEAAWLLQQWREVEQRADRPGLLRAAPGPTSIALRDWTAHGGRIQILASDRLRVLAGLSDIAPADPIHNLIEDGGEDLFERLDVWGRAEAALAPRQVLPDGGAITLEATEALVAVDVDSGLGAAHQADRQAAAELPRLLRLRGLGGLVAADFLARASDERRRIEQALDKALAADPVETETLGWTLGGLLELRRKRARRVLTRAALEGWLRN